MNNFYYIVLIHYIQPLQGVYKTKIDSSIILNIITKKKIENTRTVCWKCQIIFKLNIAIDRENALSAHFGLFILIQMINENVERLQSMIIFHISFKGELNKQRIRATESILKNKWKIRRIYFVKCSAMY